MVAYRLTLPLELATIHNVFHVLISKKYATNLSQILHQDPVKGHAVQILSREEKTIRNKVIPRVKVM